MGEESLMDVYGIVGTPVDHSLSPPVFEAAFEEYGMDARFVTFDAGRDVAERVVDGAEALGIAGLLVTMPLKQAVVPHVSPTESAEKIGAVNTIALSEDDPRGFNTDRKAILRSLERHGIDLSGTVTIVGAGGAGKAAAFALTGEGMDIHVLNRSPEKARRLAERLPDATGDGLDALSEVVPESDLLLNMTSVGMEEDVTPVPAELLHEELVVLDAVYTPVETRLLQDAAAAGATTIPGNWMSLYSCAEAFREMTGREPPVEAMNEEFQRQLDNRDVHA
jgi:shikimate dehydrogenase